MKKLTQLACSAVALSLALLSLGAAAQGGLYLEAKAGVTDADFELDFSPVTVSMSGDDQIYGVGIGYAFSDYFAVEAIWTDYGKPPGDYDAELSGGLSGFAGNASVDIRATSLSLVGKLPLFRWFSLYGRVGYTKWNADFDFRSGVVGTGDDNGNDYVYAAGATFSVTDSLDLFVEYEQFSFDANVSGLDTDVDLGTISTGVNLKF